MKLRSDLAIGVATHTGRVRSSNEDDYLLFAPEEPARERELGRWFVIADGMGGVTGGAEASRIAVRALVAHALRQPGVDPAERMRRGFLAACQRVFATSRANAALRDMGTTMTALNLLGRQLVIGHVGDSRCWVWRGGRLTLLTTDHAGSSGDHHLTRCIGGGRDSEQVDVLTFEVEKGDTIALGTDGLWEAIPEAELTQILRQEQPQRAAEKLVQRANAGGGQDNATAIVIAVRGQDDAPVVEVLLASDEAQEPFGPPARVPRVGPARWPWFVLLLAALGFGIAVAKSAFGWDAVALARRLLAR